MIVLLGHMTHALVTRVGAPAAIGAINGELSYVLHVKSTLFAEHLLF
jgi:hypothetical protein